MASKTDQYLEKAPDAFCIQPFTHVSFGQDGRINLCCRSIEPETNNLKNVAVGELWNSPQFVNARKQMLKNERPEACRSCWEMESRGMMSYRQEGFRPESSQRRWFDNDVRFDDETAVMSSGVQNMKIYLSSLCNLRCRMCNPEHSTRWQSLVDGDPELRAWIRAADRYGNFGNSYGRPDPLVPNYQERVIEFVGKNLDDIRTVNFVGGEPLLHKEHAQIMKMLEGRESKIELIYDTNMTNIKGPTAASIYSWPKFDRVHVHISIDGPPSVFEYVRPGLDASVVERNIAHLQKSFGTTGPDSRIYLRGVCTFSAYNAHFAVEAAKYITSLGLTFISNQVEFPYFVAAEILPPEEKAIASRKIQAFLDDLEREIQPSFEANEFWREQGRREHQLKWLRTYMLNTLNSINGRDDSEHFAKFLEFDLLLNKSAGKSILDIHPSWERYLPRRAATPPPSKRRWLSGLSRLFAPVE